MIDKSPPSSIDGLSMDEGVESKGSIDEPTNLGISPSAYVHFYRFFVQCNVIYAGVWFEKADFRCDFLFLPRAREST